VLELIQSALGFVSASFVAVIAAAFGAMFLFFSGASALVLGQFLQFARGRVALIAVAAGALLVLGISVLTDQEQAVWLAGAQVAWSGIAFGMYRWKASHRFLPYAAGGLVLAAAALFLAAQAVPDLEQLAQITVAVALQVLLGAAVGLWPLVIAGLVQHRRERPVEWFISLRYLVAKRRQTFISVITVICVTGVALGVAVITVVLSVMNGFSQVWEEKVIGARAHFVVNSVVGTFPGYQDVRNAVAEVDGVTGATPFLESEAILRSDTGELQAILLKGIDPATVGQATQLERDMVAGSLSDLAVGAVADGQQERAPGVVLGFELADRFFLRVGDPVILIAPLGGPNTPLGPAPRMMKFRVAGVFRANFYQFDEGFAYTDLAGAQKFMKLEDEVSGIEVRTADAYRSEQVAQRVEAQLGEAFRSRDWKRFYPGFFEALKNERVMMFVLLSFIMVVAGFIIIATLIMMIMEKSRDIAILKAMGCDDDGVLRIFAIEGVLIGLAGLGLGLAMGLLLTWNLDLIQGVVEAVTGYDPLPPNVYQLRQLPYAIEPSQIALISLIAMVLSIGATLLPSWQAARLDPAEALRYE